MNVIFMLTSLPICVVTERKTLPDMNWPVKRTIGKAQAMECRGSDVTTAVQQQATRAVRATGVFALWFTRAV